MDKENKADVMSDWKAEFTKRVQTESKTRKETFTFYDACKKERYPIIIGRQRI
jgi:hypothetical protein